MSSGHALDNIWVKVLEAVGLRMRGVSLPLIERVSLLLESSQTLQSIFGWYNLETTEDSILSAVSQNMHNPGNHLPL